MKPNYNLYLASISEEMKARSNQVRNLIGSSHWLSDGKHKEKIIVDIIARYLPQGYLVGGGFVVDQGNPNHISREQDVLIFDIRNEPPLFRCGDLIISTGASLVAAISVKTKFKTEEISDSVATLLTAREVCAASGFGNRIWCGMFAFECEDDVSRMVPGIAKEIAKSPYLRRKGGEGDAKCGPDAFCVATNSVIVADYGNQINESKSEFGQLRGFNLGERSAAVFLGLILEAVSDRNKDTHSDVSRILSCFDEDQEPSIEKISRKGDPTGRKHPRKKKR